MAADAVLLYVWWTSRKAPAAPPVETPRAPESPPPVVARPAVAEAGPSGSDPDRMPGGCRSVSECEEYCADPANRQECADFLGPVAPAEPEDAPRRPALAEPAQGEPGGAPAGPGGCRGEAECGSYCSDPGHAEECRAFALKERGRVVASLKAAPPGTQACMRSRLGGREYADLLAGRREVDGAAAQAMSFCFQKKDDVGPKRASKQGGIEGGPGGCATQAACVAYCTKPENRDECLAWDSLPEQFRTMLENAGE